VLANGVRLLVREDFTAAVVAVSLQIRAGARDEQPEEAGAGRRTGAERVEATEDLGGALEASGEADTAEVRGRASAARRPSRGRRVRTWRGGTPRSIAPIGWHSRSPGRSSAIA
jgi:hypothetical protein